MRNHGRQTWDALGTIQLLGESARRLLGEGDDMTKRLGRLEEGVDQAGKLSLENVRCVEASWSKLMS